MKYKVVEAKCSRYPDFGCQELKKLDLPIKAETHSNGILDYEDCERFEDDIIYFFCETEIDEVGDLGLISKLTGCELVMNFSEMKIILYNDYLE